MTERRNERKGTRPQRVEWSGWTYEVDRDGSVFFVTDRGTRRRVLGAVARRVRAEAELQSARSGRVTP